MVKTSLSLLQRVRSGTETQSWNRFVRIYSPIVHQWASAKGVPASDANDLVQEVFRSLIRALPTLELKRQGSFGRWLRTVTNNKCNDYFRRQSRRPAATNSEAEHWETTDDDDFAEKEYRHMLAKRALTIMQSEFESTTWKACWMHVVSGLSAAKIAEELGISTNAVYVSKSRVLRRLREELDGLWE